MNFPQFLELKFLEWQKQQGGRKTVKEFADYIGVSQSTISMWWNEGRKPEGENLLKLALKLGMDVYDILGKPRPDPDLYYLQTIWETLSPEKRQSLREKAQTYAAENIEGRNMNEDEDLKLLSEAWEHLSHLQRKMIVLRARISMVEIAFFIAVIFVFLFISRILVPIPHRKRRAHYLT